MAAQPAHTLPSVFGRYRVERLLGRGGMGCVYLAHDQQLSRPVALKIPRQGPDESSQLLARLQREALSVAALNHPNICPVYDAGEIDGIHYLAMAFIKGRSLTDYLQTAKPQSERAAARTVLKIAKALDEAHRRGIVHRDLKPANIMIDSRGEPIVMDFGLACRLDSDQQTQLTQEGSMVGTPAYMSPEQIDHRSPVGPASDIYSLGVVLYELLARRCPFEGSLPSVVGQILHGEPPAIESRRADVSPELASICRKAMARKPDERFGSMQEFAGALATFIRDKPSGTLATSPLPDPAAEDQRATVPPASPARTAALSRASGFGLSPRRLAIGGGLAIAVLLAAGLVLYATRPGPGDSSPRSSGPGAPPPPPRDAPLRMEDSVRKAAKENLQRLDRNGNGLVTADEAPLHIVWRADRNNDDAIDLAEMEDAYVRLQDRLFAPPTEAERESLPPHFLGPPPRPGPGPGPHPERPPPHRPPPHGPPPHGPPPPGPPL